MAHDVEPALDVISSTPGSSPSDILGDTKIRRSLVKIPSAQKELLNLHQSWASYLSQRSNGFINVPPQVLDQLVDAYTRQKEAAKSDKTTRPASDGDDDPGAPEPSGSQSSTPVRAEHSDEDGDDNNKDPSQRIPWSISPDPPRFKSQEPSEEPSQESSQEPNEEPNEEPSEEPSQEPRQPFITQIPEKSPPKPTIPTSSSEKVRLAAFPQSSQGPEDELEVEVPVALAYNLEPINKSALPMLATPPSAQIVPCTFEQSLQSTSTNASTRLEPQPKPQSRRHIYNRVPELYRGPKQGVLSSHLNTNVDSNNATATLGQHTDTESSLSANNTSSSIIPSTRDDQTTESQKHIAAWDVRPGQITTDDTNFSPGNHHSPAVSRQYSPIQMTSPSQASHSSQPPIPVTHPAVPPAAAPKSWEAPFAHYVVTYPSYIGTIHDFVTACIYIQLQYRRIRTSLYDDFIRAWVEGYLPYVKYCDEAEPPRKALRAIEWYNEIDDDPLFTSRVVTRQNLESILNFYPNELEMARLSLGIASSQNLSEHMVSSSPAGQLNRPSQFLARAQPKGKEPMQNPVEAAGGEASVSRLPPIPKSKIRTVTTNEHIPTNKSFGGIESRPVQREALTRSLSESTAHKRIATNELRSEGTKRVSVGLTVGTHSKMWSDSGSTASNYSERSRSTARNPVTSESTTRQRSAKAAEDPEERRRRRLAKHFKKAIAKRESIASSAPISNTPTSGQRQKQ